MLRPIEPLVLLFALSAHSRAPQHALEAAHHRPRAHPRPSDRGEHTDGLDQHLLHRGLWAVRIDVRGRVHADEQRAQAAGDAVNRRDVERVVDAQQLLEQQHPKAGKGGRR